MSLRAKVRQLGLGRLAYRWVFKPAQQVDLARQYGWKLMWDARRGDAMMRQAAEQLPPLASSSHYRFDVPVCFLTGAGFIHQTLFCAHSFAHHLGGPFNLHVLSDGSLEAQHSATLRTLFPNCTVARAEESEQRVREALPPERFPVLHAHRRRFVLLRKLTDAMAGQRGYRLFFDSDMLFWKRPVELLDRGNAGDPFYMADTVDDGYTVPRAILRERFGVKVAAGVNSGLVGAHAERIDWELMERVCQFLLNSPGDQRLLEQTLWAVVLGAQSARPLTPETYRVVVDPAMWTAARAATPQPVLMHYAWHGRFPYTAKEWPRYLAELAA